MARRPVPRPGAVPGPAGPPPVTFTVLTVLAMPTVLAVLSAVTHVTGSSKQ
ncbi:hypothetical protein [Streptomyces mayonensis]|uniref:hypothetical protein n=1 Tax=Streptomyces mayonensis TaxID=2750816 RepID=UPI001C1DF687|nr:hypothetical protein [Streptomyces sp. A108]MBU6532350.1 hypothetical protein [Streptomyces sp. A108]